MKGFKERVSDYSGDSFVPLREQDLGSFREICRSFQVDVTPDYPGVEAEEKKIDSEHGVIHFKHYLNEKSEGKDCIIYVFAGGFIEGDLNSQDSICRYISEKTKKNVVAVGYRLAPEFKYPCAHTDVYQTISFVVSNLIQYEKFHLLGYSSGGNLALSSLCRFIKEESDLLEKLTTLLLVAPFLNLNISDEHQVDGVMLDVKDLQHMKSLYLDGTSTEAIDPKVSPFFESDDVLSKLPKMKVISMAHDPLSKESYSFYRRASDLGVDVSFSEHNFIHLEFALMATLFKGMSGSPLDEACCFYN